MATENKNPIDGIDPVDPIPEGGGGGNVIESPEGGEIEEGGSTTTTPSSPPLPDDTEPSAYFELGETKTFQATNEGVVYGYVCNNSDVTKLSLVIQPIGSVNIRVVKTKDGSHQKVREDESVSSTKNITLNNEIGWTYCIQFWGNKFLSATLSRWIPIDPESIENPRKVFKGGELYVVKEVLL